MTRAGARAAAAAPDDVLVDPSRRPSLTGRAAMLAVVVCMLALSLAYPLREYLSQRGDLEEYRTRVAAQQGRVAELERERARWRDPTYVRAQARERLRYVMPGETAYVVLGPGRAPGPGGAPERPPADPERGPWYGDLWRSVEAAGKG